MAVRLSQGSISAIMEGEKVVKPVLQLMSIRSISAGNGPPRYRLLMSDGATTLSSFMLATQLNPMVEEEKLVANSICQVNRFIVNTLKDGRQVVILMDVDVLGRGDATAAQMGHPVQHLESSGPRGNPSQAAGPAANQAASSSSSSSTPLQQSESSAGTSAGNVVKQNSAAAAAGPLWKPCTPVTPGTPGSVRPKVVPIVSLNPYQSKWTICVRVTQKGQIRTWSNSRGEGKLFSVELVDESGEIRATAFNEQADKFFPLLEINKVYYFSKGNLKSANKQYTAVKNDYEITFTKDTVVVPCEEDLNLPSIQFDFVSIGDLEKVNPGAIVDILGICQSYSDVTKVMVKASSQQVSKRDIHLMDMSGKMVTVALWGPEAEKFEGSRHPVVAIKGSKVSDFGGRSLSVLMSSTVIVNPDRPEAFQLRGWFDSEGQRLEPVSISNTRASPAAGNACWKSLREAQKDSLKLKGKAEYFTCVATVVHMRKDNCLYKACPNGTCHKKVIDEQNGLYRCEKCEQDFPSFKYRMILGVNIVDYQTNQWITCFQETAEVIVGQSTSYLGELKEKDERAFEEVFQKANFSTYQFRIRVQHDNYKDEFRLKMSAVEVKPVDCKEYAKYLIANIRKRAATLRR